MLSAEGVGSLLDELCVSLGFCLPAEARRRLAHDPPETVDAFAAAVLRAEGLDPAAVDRGVYRQLRDAVARRSTPSRP
jgi:hypothetical protein